MTFDFKEDSTLLIRVAKIHNDGCRKGILGLLALRDPASDPGGLADQADRKGGPAVITWKGTWDFALRSSVIQAWEAVTLEHRSKGLVIVKELLDATVVRNHGDAIQHLKLLTAVIRHVSLWQIQMEHMVRESLVGSSALLVRKIDSNYFQ